MHIKSITVSPNHPDYVPYLKTLTSLRGFAALGIVLYHARLFFPALRHPGVAPIIDKGYLWVDFFFILSGFVLTHVYGSRLGTAVNSRTYRSFMVKRFSRIYPLHLAILLASLVCAIWLTPWRFSGFTSAPDRIWSFFTHLMLLNSVHLTSNLSWNIPAWAIGAEMLSYTIFPQILWVTHRVRPMIAGAIYLCSLVFLAALVANLAPRGNLDMTWDYGFLRCLLEFTGGVILCNLYFQKRTSRMLRSDLAPVISLAAIVAVMYLDGPDLLVVPANGALIVTTAANNGRIKSLLSFQFLQWFGDISYAMYLVHWLILWVFFDVSNRLGVRETVYGIGGWLQFVGPMTYFLTVLVVADFSHRWFEKPLRDRINKILAY